MAKIISTSKFARPTENTFIKLFDVKFKDKIILIKVEVILLKLWGDGIQDVSITFKSSASNFHHHQTSINTKQKRITSQFINQSLIQFINESSSNSFFDSAYNSPSKSVHVS